VATTPPEPALQVIGRDGRGLRVVFQRQTDRCAHRIEIIDGARSFCLLTSVEGTSDQPWPPSPPLQQLSIEELSPGNRVALLLGMAGKSHWSASVECDPASLSLLFDVACRVQQPPLRLGSCYRTEVPLAEGSLDRARFTTAWGAVTLQLPPLENLPSVALALPANHIAVVYQDLTVARVPSTLRWKYRVTLAKDGDLCR
jgi:hypothetical protein